MPKSLGNPSQRLISRFTTLTDWGRDLASVFQAPGVLKTILTKFDLFCFKVIYIMDVRKLKTHLFQCAYGNV